METGLIISIILAVTKVLKPRRRNPVDSAEEEDGNDELAVWLFFAIFYDALMESCNSIGSP